MVRSDRLSDTRSAKTARFFIDIRLLLNTNGKPHAGSRRPYDHRNFNPEVAETALTLKILRRQYLETEDRWLPLNKDRK